MQRVWVQRWAWVLAAVLLAAVPAGAQETGGGAAAPRSFLDIVRAGVEVPTYFILLGSIVVIALIFEHFFMVRRSTVAPPDQVRRAKELIESRNFRECLEELRQSQTFFARLLTAALLRARHGFESMHEAATEKAGELSGRMFRKAEYLNIIGNLGPLLGLLGTVLGMIKAFASLGAGGGQAGSGELAGGISEALVNTLLGLALAILGIGFFGLCRNRIESLTVAAAVDVLDLLEYFRPASTAAAPRVPERPGTPVPPPRPLPPRPTGETARGNP